MKLHKCLVDLTFEKAKKCNVVHNIIWILDVDFTQDAFQTAGDNLR